MVFQPRENVGLVVLLQELLELWNYFLKSMKLTYHPFSTVCNINKNYTHASFSTVFKRYLAEIISRATCHMYICRRSLCFQNKDASPQSCRIPVPFGKNDRAATTSDLLNRTATSRWFSQKPSNRLFWLLTLFIFSRLTPSLSAPLSRNSSLKRGF